MAILLLALGALSNQNNLLFTGPWGFAFAAIIVSGVLSGSMLMGLASGAALGQVGETSNWASVTNRNQFTPAFGLWVQESRLMNPGPRAWSAARLLRQARGGAPGRPAPAGA